MNKTLKHIGILAHSAEGAALCYLEACHEAAKRMGAHMHPDITLSTTAMGLSMPHWEANNLPPIQIILAGDAEKLKAAGCDFFICPDNTAHLAMEIKSPPLALPGLHIARVVAAKAKTKGFQNIGVLGTCFTMEGHVYPNALKHHGLNFNIPNKTDRDVINSIIFDELCFGIFKDSSIQIFITIIEQFKRSGCDAVVLGCTEIPLIITLENSPLPTLDSTRLLAHAAVDVALGKAPMPIWRGGSPNN